MLLCSKEWVRELNSSCITLLQSDSYNCPQLSLVLLEFPLYCIPDYCFIIAYVWYPFHVCCHSSLMPRWLVQIKGYPITQQADRPRKWKRMLQKVRGERSCSERTTYKYCENVLTPNLSNNDTCGTPHVTHLLGGETGYFIWFDPERWRLEPQKFSTWCDMIWE